MAKGDPCKGDSKRCRKIVDRKCGNYCIPCSRARCKPELECQRLARVAYVRWWNLEHADRHRVHSNRCYWRSKLVRQGMNPEQARAEAEARYPYPEQSDAVQAPGR